jgi:cell division protein FtsA
LLGSGVEISQKLVKEMYDENHNLKIENAEIFCVFPQEYLVDDELECNPVGMNCSDLQGRYVVVYGKPTLKFNLDVLQDVGDGVKLVNEQLAPIASSLAALTDEDIEKGCVFVDFGAETTSVCVYFRGYLRHLFVIPFGGTTITKDLVEELNMVQADAETMKINFGNALSEMEEDRIVSKEGENEMEISTLLVSQIIEARMKEILGLIWKEISDAGLSRYLNAGFVIAGEASKLKNLDKLIELQTGCSANYANFRHRFDNKSDFNNAIVLGLLMSASENCVVSKKPIVEKPKRKGMFSGIKDKIKGVVDVVKDPGNLIFQDEYIGEKK